MDASKSEHETVAQNANIPPLPVRAYVLMILMLVNTMSILDRHIMNIMVEPIRKELHLNDAQMGLLTGMAFTLVYVAFAIPAAWLSDRWVRTRVVGIAIAVWSVMTMACGMAQNAVQLFFARFGVGFGEAGGSAPAQAFIGDIFPRHQRATAMAFMLVSAAAGQFLGLYLGAWSLDAYGWRTTFLLAGIPGLILAPLVLFTFPKVRKGASDGATVEASPVPLLSTLRTLFGLRTYRYIIIAATLQAVVASGVHAFVPAFFERSHGLSRMEIGASLGAALGLGSLIGHMAGGPLADFLGRKDLRWHFWTPMITSLLSFGLAICAFLGPWQAAMIALGLMVLVSGLFSGPMIAIIVSLAPVTGRAVASAAVFVVINLFAFGVAPGVVGGLSTLLAPTFGNESLRVALMCAAFAAVPASFFFYQASRFYREDSKQTAVRHGAV